MEEHTLEQIANKHGFSPETVQYLAGQLKDTSGLRAQFDLHELGGAGKWTLVNGVQMTYENTPPHLQARVEALLRDLWEWVTSSEYHNAESALERTLPPLPIQRPSAWWPEGWEVPDEEGNDQGMNFAYFSERRRLAIRQGVKVRYFDTQGYYIRGVTLRRRMGIPIITIHTEDGEQILLSDLQEVRA